MIGKILGKFVSKTADEKNLKREAVKSAFSAQKSAFIHLDQSAETCKRNIEKLLVLDEEEAETVWAKSVEEIKSHLNQMLAKCQESPVSEEIAKQVEQLALYQGLRGEIQHPEVFNYFYNKQIEFIEIASMLRRWVDGLESLINKVACRLDAEITSSVEQFLQVLKERTTPLERKEKEEGYYAKEFAYSLYLELASKSLAQAVSKDYIREIREILALRHPERATKAIGDIHIEVTPLDLPDSQKFRKLIYSLQELAEVMEKENLKKTYIHYFFKAWQTTMRDER